MTAFFPFNPRATRLGFVLGALGCAALAVWALWGARQGTERMGEARAAVSVGLLLAFLYAFYRLRPRRGWGVGLDADGVTLARPLSQGAIELPWNRIHRVLRTGKRENVLVVVLDDEQRVLIGRHLFARQSDFELLFAALRNKVPEPVLDA